LDVAERYADGLLGWGELAAAEHKTARGLTPDAERASLFACWALHPHAGKGSGYAVCSIEPGEAVAHARLVRDIFGNPFRPVIVDPRWLTSTVVSLARTIYEDRAFDRLPILADALEEAGCDDADLLAHCRGDGPHVRGCWVVDLVLGRV
jgi:hypothetical protein